MKNETEVKTIEVRQYCDKCGEELTFTGEVLLSYPEKYVHRCEKCGHTEWFPKSYPCIEYKEQKRDSTNNVEFTDDFKKTLERVAAKRNKESVKKSKSEGMIFNLTPNEVDEYNKFIEEHKNCKCSATIGGKISVIFTPTGLGDAKSVKCNACGKEKEITDVSNW